MIQNGIVQRATRFRLRIRWPTRADASGRAADARARRLGVHGKKKKGGRGDWRGPRLPEFYLLAEHEGRRVRVRADRFGARARRAAAAQVRRGRAWRRTPRTPPPRSPPPRSPRPATPRLKTPPRRHESAAVEGVDGRYEVRARAARGAVRALRVRETPVWLARARTGKDCAPYATGALPRRVEMQLMRAAPAFRRASRRMGPRVRGTKGRNERGTVRLRTRSTRGTGRRSRR